MRSAIGALKTKILEKEITNKALKPSKKACHLNQLLDFMKRLLKYILNIRGKHCVGSEPDGKNDLYPHEESCPGQT
jgi:hypothetical protein